MGIFVSVRGWLQVDHEQREAVESIIAAAYRDLYSEARDSRKAV
jgi:hypothetical protein